TMGTREELRDLLSFLDITGLRPQIGAEMPMSEAERGFKAMLDGETAGKIVFTR
ncbi:MAG: Zn-dependent oxidoreductase, partial [Pseudonocardia sp.]|nr:Zn-dependent oxidoreductase [Pseudonocardia sp.]